MAIIKIGKNAEGRITVAFPYNEIHKAKIKSIPGRKFHDEGGEKYWSLPFSSDIMKRLESIFEDENLDIDPSTMEGTAETAPKGIEISKNAEGRITVTFKIFDPDYVTKIKSIPGRKFHDEGGEKYWSLPFSSDIMKRLEHIFGGDIYIDPSVSQIVKTIEGIVKSVPKGIEISRNEGTAEISRNEGTAKTAPKGIKIGKNDEGRITVAFPYNEIHRAKIKTIQSYRWHPPPEKYWSIPFSNDNMKKLESIFEGEILDIDPSVLQTVKTVEGIVKVEKPVKPAFREIINEHSQHVFTEIFPVLLTEIPKLFAYKLVIGGEEISTIGYKLSYQLARKFKGHWVWTNNRIVTDTLRTREEIMNVVEELWSPEQPVFNNLRDVKQDIDWQPTSQANAAFMARGLFTDLEPEIKKIMYGNVQDIGPAWVERVHDIREWEVQDYPAISISISSRLIYKQDLKSYANNVPPEDLIGLWVADKTSTLKGEIIRVEGRLSQHRKRLLALTKREEMQEIIEKASDEELIIRVLSGHNQYDYVVSALRIILRMGDLSRFNVDSRQVLKALQIEPRLRFQLVKEVSNIAINRKLVKKAYSSIDSNGMFLNVADLGYVPSLCFGNNKIVPYNEKTLLSSLHNYGLYKVSERFQNKVPINIGIVNALPISINAFWSKLQQELRTLNFEVHLVKEEKLQGIARIDLEKAIGNLQTQNPDILLVFFPDEQGEDDDEQGAYHNLKYLTIGRGIASQVVYQATLDKPFAIANIVLGVLAKTGNIPFILSEALPYTDIVVGIDIARERKKHLAGSINAIAITRIYFSNGEFLHYVIHDAPLEGETIPDNVLQSLFPFSEFKDKRVIIHRDGFFRGNEKQILREWAKKIGAEFYLVEIIKTGTPRIYGIQADTDTIQQPPKGSVFKLSDKEAFLISSLPPFRNVTPQPLRIRTEAPLTIEQAIHSVLSLTLLHYGSLRPPRLPVTIHYSDRIAYLALRGIKPKNLEGNIPFWL